MTVLYNLAKMSTATTGTGATLTLGSAISGYLTFANAGVTDGTVVSYGIRDGANSEVGTGTYTDAGTTLTRNVTTSTNSNNRINLSGSAEVYITARTQDIVNKTGDTMTGALTLLNTGLKVQDTDASNVLSIVPGSNLTVDRTLTFTTGDANRNITLQGDTTIPASFPTSTTTNTVPKFSNTSGSFTTSGVGIDASNNVTGVGTLDIGNADTTIARVSAGVISVEGSNVLMASNIGGSVQGYSANLASLATNYSAPTTTVAAQLNLLEATNNGANYLTLLPPVSIASNRLVSFQDVEGTVYVSNGTDVALTDGGTGASSAAAARVNLQCGDGGITGTGSLVLSSSPTLSTPTLGTPLAGTLTNCTGLPLSTGITGTLGVSNGGTGQTTYTNGQLLIGNTTGSTLAKATLTQGTGITITNGAGSITIANSGLTSYPASGIANSTGSAWGTSYSTSGSGTVVALTTSPSFTTPLLGTPTSGTLTNCTGLPISTGVSGLAAGVASFLATPSSANLATAVTDETGSGSLVFATSPTLVTPALGTPSSGTLSNCTVDGTNSVGYLNIPQNTPGSWPYTLVLGDSGKHIINTGSSGVTATIPANSSVAFAVGTAVTFVNTGSGAVTISITTDTLYLAGAGTTGSRTLAQWGVATAIKVSSTSWIISGTNLT